MFDLLRIIITTITTNIIKNNAINNIVSVEIPDAAGVADVAGADEAADVAGAADAVVGVEDPVAVDPVVEEPVAVAAGAAGAGWGANGLEPVTPGGGGGGGGGFGMHGLEGPFGQYNPPLSQHC